MLGAAQATLLGVQREAPWSPASLSNLLYWADLADGDTVFTDDGVTKAVDGNLIYRISDKSGNGKHWKQATSTSRPTYKTGANGLNGNGIALSSDGLRHMPGSGAAYALDGPHTFYFLAKTPTISGYIAAGGGTSGVTGIRLGRLAGKATILTNSSYLDGSVNLSTTSPYILTGVLSSADTILKTNNGGDQIPSISNFTAFHVDRALDTTHPSLMGRYDGILKLVANSYIAEIIWYHAEHDATTQAIVHDYLNTKWAVY